MPAMTIEQALALAAQRQEAGALREAEAVYRRILAHQPGHAGALHQLGLIAGRMGRHERAADLIRQAIALNPGAAEMHNHLGIALGGCGRFADALAAFRQALSLRPEFPEARCNLGAALRECGQIAAAIAACREALSLRPDYPMALYNLANALRDNGEPAAAIAAYRQAIALAPGMAEAHGNLGHVLGETGETAAAIASFRQAAALRPDSDDARNNLGAALREAGQLAEAADVLRQAIALRPDRPQVYQNLGNVLHDQGQLEAAIEAYRRASALAPDSPNALLNLAHALNEKGQLEEACAVCRRAIAVDATCVDAQTTLGNIFKEMGDLDAALAAYRQALRIKPDDLEAGDNLILALHYHPGCDPRAIAGELAAWNLRHAEPLKPFIQPHDNDRSPQRRLRIGYVSADFRRHPVGRFMLPLLAHHDKTQVEIFAYAGVSAPDAITQALRGHVDAWRDIAPLPDAKLADLVRADRIDILVDLSLHTAGNRLLVFARKPAPLQVAFLGYAGSSGLPAMDYRLTDAFLEPPEPPGNPPSVDCETPLHLPGTYWCYPVNPAAPEVNALPAPAAGHVTFACSNNFCKVNDGTLEVWRHILAAIPRSELRLHALEGPHRRRVLAFLAQAGIDPERIAFAGRLPLKQYFAQYHAVDVALDTFPFAGATTTCDALWMGVPVVSVAGATAVGRAGASILAHAGIPELVAHSPEQYVRIAVELAADLPRLQHLRASLRQRMKTSPLMDAPRFAREIESVYRRMWIAWCAGGHAT